MAQPTGRAPADEGFAREVISSISDPLVVYDSEWRFRFINEAAAGIFAGGGRSPETLAGQVLWDVYPQIRGSATEKQMRDAMRDRVTSSFESRNNDTGNWSEVVCYPLPDGGLAVQWKDITQRRRAEEAAHYLARASEVLSSSLDVTKTMEDLARICVPELADWCAIDTRGPGGLLKRVAVAHVDPEKLSLGRELERRYPSDPNSGTGAHNVLRTGMPEIYPELTDEMLVQGARDADHLDLIRRLGLRSLIFVPIQARGRTHGVLTLVTAESKRRYNEKDVDLAMEIARRTGLALDNAELFEQARDSAERTMRLQAMTARLASIVNPTDVGNAVIDAAMTAFEARNAALCLISGDGKQLEIMASHGIRDETERQFHVFPVDAPLPLSEAVRRREPIFLSNRAEVVRRYPALAEANRKATGESWIALPLIVAGDVVGGLSLGLPQPRDFSNEDRSFAIALSQQAAQALERTRLYEAERQARSEAEQANRAKSDFLATMSHELRTPLNAIGGYAELLEMGLHGQLSEQQKTAVERIRRSERRLRALIEDVLAFARIEAGKLEVNPRSIPVRDLIADLETLISPQIEARRIRFSFENCDAALTAWADPERVHQILLNLVGNAIKFTPEGGSITVTGDVTDQRVTIAVHDTGSGIPADKLDAIFDPFVQLGRSLASPGEGSGLGLAISRESARAMRGELTVASKLGEGSTFTLTLPRTADA